MVLLLRGDHQVTLGEDMTRTIISWLIWAARPDGQFAEPTTPAIAGLCSLGGRELPPVPYRTRLHLSMPKFIHLRPAVAVLLFVFAFTSSRAEDTVGSETFPVGTCGRKSGLEAQDDHYFLVFFQPNSAEVSSRGKQIIQELLNWRGRYGGDGVVWVVGNVDATEARTTNNLDIRRAQAVRNVLIEDGLNPRAIVLRPDGDTHMLVPTDQSEPQNRNVGFFFPGLGHETGQAKRRACADWIRASCLSIPRIRSMDACDKALSFLAP
jgi:hypothetical protein